MQVTHMQSTANFDRGGTVLICMFDILFCVFIIIVAGDAYYKASAPFIW